jgi:uncharacterized membrane protein
MNTLVRDQAHSPQLYGVRFLQASKRGDGTVLLTPARVFTVAALSIIIIAAGLRFYHLGKRSLWFDEAVTANASRGTLAEVLEETRARGSAPIIHPTVLYLSEKIGKSADVVRAPSLAASLLAVVMMLMMVRAGIDPWSALFAAAILAVSGSQVRYAQEVREYSFAVLCGAVLIYCLLRWEAAGSRDRHPFWLYAAMFFAPLTQYGLVFLAAAILGTMLLRCIATKDTRFRFGQVVLGSFFLACGAVVSYVLTLRYQFRPGKGQWYLAANYFDPKSMGLLHFLATNSKQVVSFFIPGQIVAVCFVLAATIFCWKQFRTRHFETITLVVVLSFALTICASLLKMYPYGGIRQCLFLAPGLILFAGVAFGGIVQSLQKQRRLAVVLAVLVLILLSGYRGLLKQWPYKEYEDTVSILKELSRSCAPSDEVWVNHDAVEAVDFYLQGRDRRFVYGTYQKDPREYIPELSSTINPHTKRLWLVFSHLQQPSDLSEEQFIVQGLSPEWTVRPVIAPTNAALYFAQRTRAR